MTCFVFLQGGGERWGDEAKGRWDEEEKERKGDGDIVAWVDTKVK